MHARFWRELNPVGPVEEMLVNQIVTAHWRLRRALMAESGEIALSVDEGQWNRSRPNPVLIGMEWEILGDPSHSMEKTFIGNRILEKELKEVRASIEKEGELTEGAVQSVLFRGKPYRLTRDLEELRFELQQNPEGLEQAVWRAKQKEKALAYIDRRLRSIEWQRDACEEREKIEEKARQAAAVLPSIDVLDKIMRYETKLERQMYRAMAQLERLQRMR